MVPSANLSPKAVDRTRPKTGSAGLPEVAELTRAISVRVKTGSRGTELVGFEVSNEGMPRDMSDH